MRLRLQEIRRLGSESDAPLGIPAIVGLGCSSDFHVERKAVCIYSQLSRCTSSEVAAMITGLLRHAKANAGRAQLCRYPRTIGNRVCFLFLVGLSALAAPEESAGPIAL